MTSGTRLVAALLTVAAALTSTAADAAVAVAGSRGPPDNPHDRGAPPHSPWQVRGSGHAQGRGGDREPRHF
jgi:hypothetical protein